MLDEDDAIPRTIATFGPTTRPPQQSTLRRKSEHEPRRPEKGRVAAARAKFDQRLSLRERGGVDHRRRRRAAAQDEDDDDDAAPKAKSGAQQHPSTPEERCAASPPSIKRIAASTSTPAQKDQSTSRMTEEGLGQQGHTRKRVIDGRRQDVDGKEIHTRFLGGSTVPTFSPVVAVVAPAPEKRGGTGGNKLPPLAKSNGAASDQNFTKSKQNHHPPDDHGPGHKKRDSHASFASDIWDGILSEGAGGPGDPRRSPGGNLGVEISLGGTANGAPHLAMSPLRGDSDSLGSLNPTEVEAAEIAVADVMKSLRLGASQRKSGGKRRDGAKLSPRAFLGGYWPADDNANVAQGKGNVNFGLPPRNDRTDAKTEHRPKDNGFEIGTQGSPFFADDNLDEAERKVNDNFGFPPRNDRTDGKTEHSSKDNGFEVGSQGDPFFANANLDEAERKDNDNFGLPPGNDRTDGKTEHSPKDNGFEVGSQGDPFFVQGRRKYSSVWNDQGAAADRRAVSRERCGSKEGSLILGDLAAMQSDELSEVGALILKDLAATASIAASTRSSLASCTSDRRDSYGSLTSLGSKSSKRSAYWRRKKGGNGIELKKERDDDSAASASQDASSTPEITTNKTFPKDAELTPRVAHISKPLSEDEDDNMGEAAQETSAPRGPVRLQPRVRIDSLSSAGAAPLDSVLPIHPLSNGTPFLPTVGGSGSGGVELSPAGLPLSVKPSSALFSASAGDFPLPDEWREDLTDTDNGSSIRGSEDEVATNGDTINTKPSCSLSPNRVKKRDRRQRGGSGFFVRPSDNTLSTACSTHTEAFPMSSMSSLPSAMSLNFMGEGNHASVGVGVDVDDEPSYCLDDDDRGPLEDGKEDGEQSAGDKDDLNPLEESTGEGGWSTEARPRPEQEELGKSSSPGILSHRKRLSADGSGALIDVALATAAAPVKAKVKAKRLLPQPDAPGGLDPPGAPESPPPRTGGDDDAVEVAISPSSTAGSPVSAPPARVVPVVVLLVDLPRRRYELLSLSVDWDVAMVGDVLESVALCLGQDEGDGGGVPAAAPPSCIRVSGGPLGNADGEADGGGNGNCSTGTCPFSPVSPMSPASGFEHSSPGSQGRKSLIPNPNSPPCRTIDVQPRSESFADESSSVSSMSFRFRSDGNDSAPSSRKVDGRGGLRDWPVRYDGLVQHRRPAAPASEAGGKADEDESVVLEQKLAKARVMPLINCIGMWRYEAVPHEVFLAKPKGMSAKEASRHAERLIQQLVNIGMLQSSSLDMSVSLETSRVDDDDRAHETAVTLTFQARDRAVAFDGRDAAAVEDVDDGCPMRASPMAFDPPFRRCSVRPERRAKASAAPPSSDGRKKIAVWTGPEQQSPPPPPLTSSTPASAPSQMEGGFEIGIDGAAAWKESFPDSRKKLQQQPQGGRKTRATKPGSFDSAIADRRSLRRPSHKTRRQSSAPAPGTFEAAAGRSTSSISPGGGDGCAGEGLLNIEWDERAAASSRLKGSNAGGSSYSRRSGKVAVAVPAAVGGKLKKMGYLAKIGKRSGGLLRERAAFSKLDHNEHGQWDTRTVTTLPPEDQVDC